MSDQTTKELVKLHADERDRANKLGRLLLTAVDKLKESSYVDYKQLGLKIEEEARECW